MNPRWIVIVFLIIVISVNTQSQTVNSTDSNQIPADLNIIIKQMPSDLNKIDNITIRLLRSKVSPQNATECIKAIPRLLGMQNFREMGRVKRSRVLKNFIWYFDEIFPSVNIDTYFEVCNSLKDDSDNHTYIYTLVNQSLRKVPQSTREKYVPRIIDLMPLSEPNNALIISSLYVNLGEERCFEVIEELKKKYADNQSFVQEIEETKEQMIYNKTHKSLNTNVKVSP